MEYCSWCLFTADDLPLSSPGPQSLHDGRTLLMTLTTAKKEGPFLPHTCALQASSLLFVEGLGLQVYSAVQSSLFQTSVTALLSCSPCSQKRPRQNLPWYWVSVFFRSMINALEKIVDRSRIGVYTNAALERLPEPQLCP